MVFWQKNRERYNLECVDVLQECDPKCPEVFPGVIPCFWFILPFMRNNVQKKLEFFAQFTATMMYYVVVRITPGLILEHSIY